MSVRDFNTDHLEPRAAEIAKAIVAHMTDQLNQAPDGGGCRAFYDVEEWVERGEAHGHGAVLILCHDGGDLCEFMEYPDEGEFSYGFDELLTELGVYASPCTGWYTALYDLEAK